MATKTFKYGHLFSTSASTLPNHDQMTPGEIGFIYNETDNVYKIFADQGAKVVDLGAKIGGKGDEKTIDTQLVSGNTIISSLVYIKDVTSEFTGDTLPANVAKRFALVNAQGENVVTSANTGASITSNTSEYIDIYKDSSIVEIYVGTEWDTVDSGTGVVTKLKIDDPIPETTGKVTADDFKYLNYVYFAGVTPISGKSDGAYYMTQIDLDKFMKEGQYASGVTTNDQGIVTGVVDSRQDALVVEWSDGDATAAGTATTEIQSGLTVGESGFSLNRVQDAINARHANVIKMNGYPETTGDTEDVFEIASGDTIMQAIRKIELKVESNGDGKSTTTLTGGTTNSGILFVEGSDETVILNAGTF